MVAKKPNRAPAQGLDLGPVPKFLRPGAKAQAWGLAWVQDICGPSLGHGSRHWPHGGSRAQDCDTKPWSQSWDSGP